jgi:hypothetical protein
MLQLSIKQRIKILDCVCSYADEYRVKFEVFMTVTIKIKVLWM